MKTTFSILLIIAAATFAVAQSDESDTAVETPAHYSKFRATISYGISAINPEQINERIGNSNYALNSSAKSIKSIPELAGAIMFRPQNDFKVLILRAGYASIERTFSISLPQTTTSPTPTGTITGEIVETYTAMPFSFGFGTTTKDNMYQFQVELIYALSTVKEEGTYRTSSGENFSYSRTLESPAYGLRVAGNATIPLSPSMGITMELGYRFMTFDEYEDEKAAAVSFLEFPVSGVSGGLGVSFTL